MKKILEKYSLVIILLLATVLRLFQIGKRDFWFDEAFTGIVVKSTSTKLLITSKVCLNPLPFPFLTEISISASG